MSKVTSFPEGLDTANKLPDIRPSDRMNDDGRKHDVQHTTLNQAVIALQRKVGANGSEDEDSLDYKVRQLEENGGGGAGLEALGEESPMFVNLDEEKIVPERASIWLSVVIAGVQYAVPAFQVIKPVIAPGAFLSMATQMIYYPKGFVGAGLWLGDFVDEKGVFAPRNVKARQSWSGSYDGE